jgi:hypothetical protein
MANTVIQLKYSSTPGNVPSGLANGEIALNYADGRFYYKNLTGQIVSFSGSGNVYSFSTINANGSLITALSNSSILTLSNGNNIEITGNIISDIITISANLSPANNWANTKLSNGTVTLAGELTTTGKIFANSQITIYPTSGGDEGGEIQLWGAGSYPDWSIDSYQNQLRFFTGNSGTQQVNFFNAVGGSLRMGINTASPSYAVDVSGDVNITGTYRVNGTPIAAGSSDLTPANNWANTVGVYANNYAGLMANSVNTYTSATYSTLTQFGSVFGVANAAFNKANSANVLAYNTGIGANAYINSVASSINSHVDLSINISTNSAYNYANSVGYSTNAYSVTRFATIENASAAFYEANLAWEFANSVAYNAAVGFAVANAAFNAANNAVTDFSPAFNKANDAYTVANAAYNYANTLSSGGGTGGFFSSTLTSFPTGDLGSGESYPLTELSDAFGVSLENVYDCMEPVGHYNLVDLGVLT